MYNAVIIFTLLSIIWCLAYGNQQHLVCKTVEDIFSEDRQSETTQRGRQPQGPPGKRGKPGIDGRRGLPGPRGPPATMDYQRINETINELIASALADFEVTMDAMLKNLSFNPADSPSTTATTGIVTEKISPTTATACSDEELIYDGICYALRGYSTSYHMDYNAAKGECSKHGSLLAEIHDRAQEDALINFLRSRNLSRGYPMQVWIGMEYHSGSLHYRSGKRVGKSKFRWWPSYPGRSASLKYLGISLNARDDQNNGIWNSVMSQDLQGVVCGKGE